MIARKPKTIALLLSALMLQAAHAQNPPPLDIKLPLAKGSLRFAVIGDSGTGDQKQYEVAKEMEIYRHAVGFDFVIMLGDNIYGAHEPRDFAQKFEIPYKPLLDGGVKFYASLGNHDDPKIEPLYKAFNMGGERYYSFKKNDVQFLALDSTYMDPKQLAWVDQTLRSSNAHWKICFFHHPLYNEGKMHGSDLDLRNQLKPLLLLYGVNAVFSGHEHAYERVKPEEGIYYFVLGSSGKLEQNDFHRTTMVDKTFDRDRTFMLVEISGDQLYFQTISRSGETVDSGSITRQASPNAASAAR
jgi:3',5'-cyclic AMP phosphodiesterase CpdA